MGSRLNSRFSSSASAIAILSAYQDPANKGFLNGTPMDSLSLKVTPGKYTFSPVSFERQMQVSDGDSAGWINTGAVFTGNSFQISGLIGKYLKCVEIAHGPNGERSTTTTSVIGPIVEFVAMPSLPLAAGAKVSAVGDSYIGYGVYAGSPVSWLGNGGPPDMSYSPINWAKAFDPRFTHDNWWDTKDPLGRNVCGANQGVFGDHIYWEHPIGNTGIINRLPGVLASQKPDILLLDLGTNTVNSADDVPASEAYLRERINFALSMVRVSGTPCILLVNYPRRDWPAGDKRYAMLDTLNNVIRDQAGRDGVTVLDGEPVLAPNGVQDATMFNGDKIHLSVKGNRYVGEQLLLPALQSMIASGSTFNQDPTVNNIIPVAQAQLQGTTGTKGANVSGVVATGYGVSIGRSLLSAVCSIDDLGNGLFGQRIVATPDPNSTVNGAYWELDFSMPLALTSGGLFAADDWVSAMVYVEKISGDDLANPRLAVQVKNGNTIVATPFAMYNDSGSFTLPMGAKDGDGWWIKSAPINLKALGTVDRLQAFINFYGSKTGQNGPMTFRISRPIIRKVADPRPLYGYAGDNVNLKDLTLSNTNFVAGAAAGTIIGQISGKTNGSVLSISPNDGRIAIDSNNNLVIGPSSSSVGATEISITETLIGALNTPHTTSIVVAATKVAMSTAFVFEGFDTLDGSGGNGLTYGAGAAVVLDTTDKIQGAASIDIQPTAGTTGNATVGYDRTPTAVYDVTQQGVHAMRVNTVDNTALTNFVLTVFRGAASNQYSPPEPQKGRRPRGWTWVAADFATAFPAVVAAGNGTMRRRAGMSGSADTGRHIKVDCWLGNAKGITSVILDADDGYKNQIPNFFEAVRARGLKANLNIELANLTGLGSGSNQRMDHADIDYLVGIGVEIINQANGSDLTAPPVADAITQMNAVRDSIIANGWDPRGRSRFHTSFPGGTWSEDLIAAMIAAGYLTGRGTQPFSFYTRFGWDNAQMCQPSPGYSPVSSANDILTQYRAAKAIGADFRPHFHDVSDNPSPIGTYTAAVAAFLDEVAADAAAGLVLNPHVSEHHAMVAARSLPLSLVA